MDLLKTTRSLRPIKGQRLSAWLHRHLTADPVALARWQGTFTEVTTAKMVEILRRRGVVEEHEADQSRFGQLINAAYRAPVYQPAEPKKQAQESGDS